MKISVNNFNVIPLVAGALSPVHTIFYRKQGLEAKNIVAFLKDGNVVVHTHTSSFPTEAHLLSIYPDAVETDLSNTAGMIEGVEAL